MGFLSILTSAAVVCSISDTIINIDEVAVSASFKTVANMQTQPLSASVFNMQTVEHQHVEAIADFAVATPNLHIPAYGSKTTSSIYVRGIGSRIDNPAVGMYIDQVPYYNKSAFDGNLWDVRRIDVLRGPQGTLFGRNTIGGIINIVTLSPADYQGTIIDIEAGNGNTLRATASTYQKPNEHLAFSIGISGKQTDGFFENEFDDSHCDWQKNIGGRCRLILNLDNWKFDNTLNVEYSDEGGYAYAQLDTTTKKLLPIAYNDNCGYQRLLITDGFVVKQASEKVKIQNVTSWQFLDDDMHLDQDFTTKSMFTLQQTQRENAITEEFTIRSANEKHRWQWLGGLSAFYKQNQMSAPVVFKKDGINELILSNANRGMQTIFPDDSIWFNEDEFTINSDFKIPVFGLAAYHQSEFQFGQFKLTAGIRFDFERIGFKYENDAQLHYNFSLVKRYNQPFTTKLKGDEHRSFVELLPKIAIQYELDNVGNIYLQASRGYKAGGYNTQMFSDILQNQMKDDLMGEFGLHLDKTADNYTIDEIIGYDPENLWNYEIGSHLNLFDNRLKSNISAFYADCRDQQLTIFPEGKNTGRMMRNAGHTRSFGIETEISAQCFNRLNINASYGYTNAKFVEFDNGKANFADNYLPYVPMHTISVSADYTFLIDSEILRKIILFAQYTGVGRIYWNEENDVWQDYYSQINVSACFQNKYAKLIFWAKNLTDTNYSNFYFVSMGNTFLSKGKPMQFGTTLKIYL